METFQTRNKYLKKFLILTIVVSILLAPISPILEKQNNGQEQSPLSFGINKAEAVENSLDIVLKKNILLLVNPTVFLAQARTAVLF